MNDPISRRLPEMQPAAQQGAKVTLPSISHVASMARAGPYGGPLADAERAPSAPANAPANAPASAPLHAPLGAPHVRSEHAHSEPPLTPYVSPPRQRTEPPEAATLHTPLKPKSRAYSSAASSGAPALAGARRRNSSGAQAAPRPGALAKTRTKSTSLSSRAKQRAQSFTYGEPAGGSAAASGKPLNTHSPIAVAAAAAVTSDKIAKLLAAQGPLPIRHITSHLSATIPGFGELSLSKQRRLIIAVLDGPRSEFVKVGWGRWAVRGHTTESAAHRESISSQLPDTKPPLSPGLHAVEDSAVFSDSEDESDEDLDDERLGGRLDDDEVEGTDEEDWRAMGPASLRQTSPREQDAIAALVQLRSK